MNDHRNGSAPVLPPTTPDMDAPTVRILALPKRVRQTPGRHRAAEGAPSSVATWAGGRHFRPEAAR